MNAKPCKTEPDCRLGGKESPTIAFCWNQDGQEDDDDDATHPQNVIRYCLLITKQCNGCEKSSENGIDAVRTQIGDIDGEDFQIEKNDKNKKKRRWEQNERCKTLPFNTSNCEIGTPKALISRSN